MKLSTMKRQAAQSARDLLLLRPYLVGRCLRRWYLQKLLAHYEMSARVEELLVREHEDNAKHFAALARGVEREIEAAKTGMEG